MLPQQKIFAFVTAMALVLLIFELVRRRKLRTEFVWLWMPAGLAVLALAFWYDLLVILTRLIGAVLPTTTLFLFSLLFLVLISLQYSVKISELSDRVKALTQEVALMKKAMERDGGEKKGKGSAPALESDDEGREEGGGEKG